jgi:hypothetical protein
MKLIDTLPSEIILYIYKEFFEPEYYYLLFSQLLMTKNSRNLVIEDIRPYIPIILSKPKVVHYFCNHFICDGYYKFFDYVYHYYKIRKLKNNFNKLKKGDGFALTLLMHIYY